MDDRPTRVDGAALDAATAHLDPPFGVLDHHALSANAHDLVRRAGRRRIRVASKSLRCRGVIDAVLGLDGYSGVLAYSLAEALWLARDHDDVVVGYPSVDRVAIAELAADPERAARITVMVDSPAQLDVIDAVSPPGRRPVINVCLDVDASLRLPGVHVGARRSPVHSVSEAGLLAALVGRRPGFAVTGLMIYEAQLAGVPDQLPSTAADRPRAVAMGWLQRRSRAELAERRAAVIAAVSAQCELRFVNGGGTGSLEYTAADPGVTEVSAGSGLFGPTLFDHYRAFTPAPAAFFCLPVVREPAPGYATVAGGGWIASGPPGGDRQPTPVWPSGLRLLPTEMAGEVQTPLRLSRERRRASGLRPGDRTWWRHAKAGELSEHLNSFHLVSEGCVTDELPTYRGEGKAW